MQKTTDKRIQEELMKLHSSSMKDSLEALSPVERKAAKEAIRDLFVEWARSTGRAEVFKKDEYPEFIGREGTAKEKRLHDTLIKLLEGAEKELKALLGDNFIAVSLIGSYAMGHAGKESDVDLILLLKDDAGENSAKALKIMQDVRMRYEGSKKHGPGSITLEETKKRIRDGYTGFSVAYSIADFFGGIPFCDNDTLYNARKEIIQELAKNPNRDDIWMGVSQQYEKAIINLLGPERTLDLGEHMQTLDSEFPKLGVSKEDFQEILKARKEFALPNFEEMKKRYGVA